MKGSAKVIDLLNEVLTGELTAINQYFLHARMCRSWGYEHLAKHIYEESIDEMKHAEALTDRILFLEGLPNYQRISPIDVGGTVSEQFRSDMAIEAAAIARLRDGATYMRSIGDITSAAIFESILADEEHHIDYLETQLELIDKLGEQLYLANVTEHPEA